MDTVLRAGIIRSMSDQITQEQIRAIEQAARVRVNYLAWLVVRLRLPEDQPAVRQAAAEVILQMVEERRHQAVD